GRITEHLTEMDACKIVRGEVDDPNLWVVVVDRGMEDWLRSIGRDRYQETREGWFQVLVIGPLLVCSMHKSQMSRGDLQERVRAVGGNLPDDDENEEVFCCLTLFGEATTRAASEGFARWLFCEEKANQENAPARPRR